MRIDACNQDMSPPIVEVDLRWRSMTVPEMVG
jgi:hypothetical protein